MKKNKIPWTRFMDMHSGGDQKEKWAYIYIQAPEEVANVIFYNRFGHSPHRVTCTCCGSDYSISETKTLEQATAYDRNCEWAGFRGKWVEKPRDGRPLITLKQYISQPDVLVIRDAEVKPEERQGEVPEQGYVWV